MKPRRRAWTRKTDRQSFRLGGGAYERPPEPAEVSVPRIHGAGEPVRITLDRGERASLQQGRRLLFATCGQMRPEFFEELHAAPMAAVQALGQCAPAAEPVAALVGVRAALADKLRYTERPWQLVTVDDRYRELREALTVWAEHFQVLDAWGMDLALGHLCSPPWDAPLLFSFPAVSAAPRLSLISWDPTVETWAQARRRMHRLIEQCHDAIEQHVAVQGLAPTPERRQLRHFHWLAGYQICRWSQHRMAKATGTDRAAVVRAIHGLAKFLGLTLRPGRSNDPAQTVETIEAALRHLPCPV